MSLKASVDSYIEYLGLGGRSSDTIRVYRRLLLQFATFTDGLPPEKEVVKSFYRGITEGRKPNTKALYYSILDSFFTYMVEEEGSLGTNPLLGNGIIRPRPEDPGSRALSKKQVTALEAKVSGAPLDVQAAFWLIREGGLRSKEICSLTLASIITAEYGIQVVVRGKGGKVRAVPLAARTPAYKAVKRYWAGEQLARESGPLFLNSRGKALSYQDLYRRWKAYLGDGHRHALRHTVATEMINHGVALDTVAGFLGHAKFDTTLRYARKADALKTQEISDFQNR